MRYDNYEPSESPEERERKSHPIYNSAPIQSLGTLADYTIAYLLWLLCCIPIITIGASTSAMYHVMMKIASDEDYRVCKGFFSTFKQNFRTRFFLWLTILLVFIFLFFDLGICEANSLPLLNIISYLIIACIFIFHLFASLIFPIQGRYGGGYRETLRNAFYVATQHFLMVLLIALLPILPFILIQYASNMYLLALLLVVGIPVLLVLQCHALLKMFIEIDKLRAR